jgi:hypothetical protein
MHELDETRKSFPITVTMCPPRTGPRLGNACSERAGFTKRNFPAEEMEEFLEIDNWTGPAPARGVVQVIKDDVR